MAITNGQNADASDFINTSAGAGDSGKVAKLNASGKHDKSFRSFFGCRVKQNAATSVTSSPTTIAFQAEDLDTDAMHDNATNNTRITIKTAGIYHVGACIRFTSTGTGSLGGKLLLNGTTVIAGGGGANGGSNDRGGLSLSTVRHFAVNDYIELSAVSPSTTQDTSGDEATNFWAILLQAD